VTDPSQAADRDDRVAMVRHHVTVLSQDFRAQYLDWFIALGGGRVDGVEATRILNGANGELQQLGLRHSTGQISAAELAMGRHRIRDLLDGVLRQEGMAPDIRGQIRHFMVDNIPTVFLDESGYRFTQDWFHFHEDHWLHHFGHLAGCANLRFLEIGSFEGRSARWMLRNLLTGAGSHLICVDPFVGYPDQERNFDHNMALAQAATKVLKLRGKSGEVLPILPQSAFDLIYIDGSHAGLDVIQDAAESWRLVKPGGIVVFDDYENAVFPDSFSLAGKPAIDAFLDMIDGRYELLFKDWQVAIRRSR
jgi:SAM-dependent methyltransferase